MSILGQATQPQGGAWGDVLVFGPPAVVSLVIAVLAGVFRRGSVVGPPRMDDRESVGVLLMILGAGFVFWIAVQVLCISPARAMSPAPAPSTEAAATRVTVTRTTPATAASSVTATQPAHGQDVPPGKMAVAATVPAIVAGAFMLVANRTLRPGGLTRMGLALRRARRGLLQGLIGGLIVVPLIFLAAQLTQVVWQAVHYDHPKEHDLLRLMGQSENPVVAVVLILSAVLVAPLFEELLFRGHLQTVVTHGLSRLSGREREWASPGEYEVVVPTQEVRAALDYAGPGAVTTGEPIPINAPSAAARWASVFLTSLVFAAVHPAWTIPPIFVLSLCLGYAYERTGNLWAVMTMHALFNATSTVLYLVVLH